MRPDLTPSPALSALAETCGVSTWYWSFFGERVTIPDSTLRSILETMGVPARDDQQVEASLRVEQERPWRSLLPPSTVVQQGGGELLTHVLDGHDVRLSIALEDGGWRDLVIPEQQPLPRVIEGETIWRVRVTLPDDLPLGWHTVHAWQRAAGADADDRSAAAPLVVTPTRLDPVPARPENGGRGWGLMSQLYSVRSYDSWGMGDFADLGDLAAIAGGRGADFVLVNPVHASDVISPMEPSPYRPVTRRFLSFLYIRPEDIRESAYLPSAAQDIFRRLRDEAGEVNTDASRIDRDAAWRAKRAALEIVFAAERSASRQAELDEFMEREGEVLVDYALWCAIEEHYDSSGEERPAEAADRCSDLVGRLRVSLADRVAFYIWLQWVAAEQMEAAQRAARASGMSIGIMHDLAVGVHDRGADVWANGELYASGMTVGAPPDMYNQLGQTWGQPPWLPRALAESGYSALRDMARMLLRGSGALRIDHVVGLFRLWWVPEGRTAVDGAYVRYDHEAMVGVLALEAHRAGAVLIGEDLGTVEPWVRDYLEARGILGTSVLWFEQDDSGPLPPERYRDQVLVTVNTHDLPPSEGYLAGDHIALRAGLGLLAEPESDVRAIAETERERMLLALRERGFLAPESGDGPASAADVIEALHAYIAATPARLIGVSLVDAVGERRVQNQPGTSSEYPNWQVPLAGPDGRAVLIDDLPRNHRFISLVETIEAGMRGRRAS